MRPYLIVGSILLIVASITLAVVLITTEEKVSEQLGQTSDTEDESKEPVILPITKPDTPSTEDKTDGEDKNEESEEENNEPTIGDNNLNLDINENLPPVKNPDPSATVGDVIYGTKGDEDGE